MNTVIIKPSDIDFCYFCDYVIGVFTESSPCNYKIYAVNSLQETALQNGVLIRGSLEPSLETYFTFDVFERKTFNIVLTSYSGDGDLYVYLNTTLGIKGIWKSDSSSRVDHVRIDEADSNFQVSNYLIKLTASDTTSYSIVSLFKDSFIEVVDGWPVDYSLAADPNDRVFFKYKLLAGVDQLDCTIRPYLRAFKPDVYISVFSHIDQTSGLYNGSAEYSYTAKDYDELYGKLRISIPVTQKAGAYMIGVYGIPSTAPSESVDLDLPVQFELSCSSNVRTIIVKVNSPEYRILLSDEDLIRFEVNLDSAGTLEIHLIPCSGTFKLIIGTKWFEQESEDVVITHVSGRGDLIGIVSHAEAGKYYITVKAPERDAFGYAEFELLPRFVRRHEQFPKLPVAGNNGIISVTDSSGQITVEWARIEYEDGTEYPNADHVQYMVYATSSMDANFATECGIFSATLNYGAEKVYSGINSEKATFNYDNETTILLNVVAIVLNDDTEESRLDRVLYNSALFNAHHVLRKPAKLLMLAIFVGAFICVVTGLLIAIICYTRYSIAKRQLNYEMQDVRNVATTVAGMWQIEKVGQDIPLQDIN